MSFSFRVIEASDHAGWPLTGINFEAGDETKSVADENPILPTLGRLIGLDLCDLKLIHGQEFRQ
jgi:hypothetical protein